MRWCCPTMVLNDLYVEARPWFSAALAGACRLKVGSLAVRALIGLCRSDADLSPDQVKAILGFLAGRPETRPWEQRELQWCCADLGLSEPQACATSNDDFWESMESFAAQWL